MKTVGLSGGAGSGKSLAAAYIQNTYAFPVVKADLLAKELMRPGGVCYDAVVKLLGEGILKENNREIDRGKMAAVIFSDSNKREAVNAAVHPVVIKVIKEKMEAARVAGKAYFFMESALLSQKAYAALVDEVWLIYAGEALRRKRLEEDRAYSKERTDAVLASQEKAAAYAQTADKILKNEGSAEELCRQIDALLADV